MDGANRFGMTKDMRIRREFTENMPKICQKLKQADTLSNQENLISDKKLSKYVSKNGKNNY